MNVFAYELRRSRRSLVIWSAAIAFMLLVTVLMYPLIEPMMESLQEIMESMEEYGFTVEDASFGDFTDYFASECAEMLGLGGAIFAAIAGIGVISREEREKTAEILFTHPVPRSKILTSKLCAVLFQIIVLNLAVAAVCTAGIFIIKADADFALLGLIALLFTLMQIEIAAIGVLIAALMRRANFAVGIGVAFFFYFLFAISSVAEKTHFLTWFTPFGFADAVSVAAGESLNYVSLAVGAAITVAAVISSYPIYNRKEIS